MLILAPAPSVARALLLPLVVTASGCWLERVTGEDVPLDPRFYAAVEESSGSPTEGSGDSAPFHGVPGDRVKVTGTVEAPDGGSIDLDVRTPDATQPGGTKGHGKLLLDGPGPFELLVPKSIGPIELQAFQDLEGDGPSGQDPFAQVNVSVGAEDLSGVRMVLAAGARGSGGPVHQEMPAGAPGGGGSGGGSGPDPFAAVEGPRVKVGGTLVWTDPTAVIDIDLYRPDPGAQGGRLRLGKIKRSAGPYTIEVPAGFGPLFIDAFIDAKGDGPTLGDPVGSPAAPVEVGQVELNGIDITLAAKVPEPPPPPKPTDPPPGGGPDGAAPAGAPGPAGAPAGTPKPAAPNPAAPKAATPQGAGGD